MSDRSPVEKGSKVSESEGSVLTAGIGDSDSILAGFCRGGEEEVENRMSQEARAEVMEMIQSMAVNTTKEMMRW